MALAADRVVEHFDVVEDFPACQFCGAADFAFKAFACKQWAKASSKSIIVAVSSPAHARS